MAFIICFLWILIWGLTGYFTVRAILTHIETKRREKAMAAYLNLRGTMRMNANRYNYANLSPNPFDDLLKKEDLA